MNFIPQLVKSLEEEFSSKKLDKLLKSLLKRHETEDDDNYEESYEALKSWIEKEHAQHEKNETHIETIETINEELEELNDKMAEEALAFEEENEWLQEENIKLKEEIDLLNSSESNTLPPSKPTTRITFETLNYSRNIELDEITYVDKVPAILCECQWLEYVKTKLGSGIFKDYAEGADGNLPDVDYNLYEKIINRLPDTEYDMIKSRVSLEYGGTGKMTFHTLNELAKIMKAQTKGIGPEYLIYLSSLRPTYKYQLKEYALFLGKQVGLLTFTEGKENVYSTLKKAMAMSVHALRLQDDQITSADDFFSAIDYLVNRFSFATETSYTPPPFQLPIAETPGSSDDE